jgi:hypothetical protein
LNSYQHIGKGALNMAKISIVELQTGDSVRDLSIHELEVMRGGGGYEYEGKEKEKEYGEEEKKKKKYSYYSYYPCHY